MARIKPGKLLAPLLMASLFCATVAAALAGAAQPEGGIEGARLVDVRTLDGELFHVQGLDMDDRHIWVTSVDTGSRRGWLHQFSRATGKFERRIELTEGPRYHPGGFSIRGDSIWVPVAEYAPHSSSVIEEIDKHSLAIRRRIAVPDHLGCLAVSGDELVAGNWDAQRLYVLDLAGKVLRSFPNPSGTPFQDIKFANGRLVGSGPSTPFGGAIDWLAQTRDGPGRAAAMTVTASLHAGMTDRGRSYTGEGMALQGRDLYLLPEDGPSRIFHYRLAR